MSKAKLRITRAFAFPANWHWEVTWRGLYICSEHQTDGYVARKSAKRAALNAARKLGLEVVEVEHE